MKKSKDIHNAVIIVAGGSGTRMQSEIPKQFLIINNKPVLWYTLHRFYSFDHNLHIILVLPKKQIAYWKELCHKYGCNIPHKIAQGGNTRFHSVKNGLALLEDEPFIAIHDGVRPLVSHHTIASCFTATAKYGAVIPVTDVVETLRKTEGKYSVTVPRSEYCLVQTPQVFKREILLDAYNVDFSENFTDDASVVEQNGNNVHLVKGNCENIKITTPEDLKIAHAFLNESND